MKKAIKFTIIILCVFSVSLNGQNKRLKKSWVKKDKLKFENLTEVLSKKELSIKYFKSEVENFSVRGNSEIWEDCNRYQAVQHGGYISSWITIITFSRKIFSIRVIVGGEDALVLKRIAEENEEINLELDRNWDYMREIDSNGKVFESYRYKYTDQSIKKQFEDKIAEGLGGLSEVEIDGELEEAYKTLIDPTENYEYGGTCYYEGIKPRGRKALEKIIEANRVDLLKNVIRGYNPEGRVYGVEGLLSIYSEDKSILTEEDEVCIKKLMESKIKLNFCAGCTILPQSCGEIFGYSEIKE